MNRISWMLFIRCRLSYFSVFIFIGLFILCSSHFFFFFFFAQIPSPLPFTLPPQPQDRPCPRGGLKWIASGEMRVGEEYAWQWKGM
jgi:hypothetical protein